MRLEISLFKNLTGASEIFMHRDPTFHTMVAGASATGLFQVESEWFYAALFSLRYHNDAPRRAQSC